MQSGGSWVSCLHVPSPRTSHVCTWPWGAGGDRVTGASLGLAWPLLTLPGSHDFSIWGLYPLADRTQGRPWSSTTGRLWTHLQTLAFSGGRGGGGGPPSPLQCAESPRQDDFKESVTETKVKSLRSRPTSQLTPDPCLHLELWLCQGQGVGTCRCRKREQGGGAVKQRHVVALSNLLRMLCPEPGPNMVPLDPVLRDQLCVLGF